MLLKTIFSFFILTDYFGFAQGDSHFSENEELLMALLDDSTSCVKYLSESLSVNSVLSSERSERVVEKFIPSSLSN